MKYFAAALNGVVVNTRELEDDDPPFTHAVVVEGANGPYAMFVPSEDRARRLRAGLGNRRPTHVVPVIEVPAVLEPGTAYPVARRSSGRRASTNH